MVVYKNEKLQETDISARVGEHIYVHIYIYTYKYIYIYVHVHRRIYAFLYVPTHLCFVYMSLLRQDLTFDFSESSSRGLIGSWE